MPYQKPRKLILLQMFCKGFLNQSRILIHYVDYIHRWLQLASGCKTYYQCLNSICNIIGIIVLLHIITVIVPSLSGHEANS